MQEGDKYSNLMGRSEGYEPYGDQTLSILQKASHGAGDRTGQEQRGDDAARAKTFTKWANSAASNYSTN